MNSQVNTLIRKEMMTALRSKEIIVPLISVLFIFVVVLPIALLIGAYFVSHSSEAITDLKPLLDVIALNISQYNASQLLIRITIDYLYPGFFLIIPIMSTSVIGASSFVGEKENQTMESLLYTPITMEDLLRGKVLGIFIPAFLITLFSFVVFGIIMNIGGFIYFNDWIFPTLSWFVIVLWVSPSISLMSLTLTALVSARAKTFQGAQQISSLLVLPIVALIVGQFTGLFVLDLTILLLLGLILFIADYFLIKLISRSFQAEKLSQS